MAKCLSKKNLGLPCVFIICYIIVVLGYGIYSYTTSRRDELKEIDGTLRFIASQIKFRLPKDFHDKAIRKDAISKEEDKRNVSSLSEYVSMTTARFGVTRVYTMVLVDGKPRLTASSRTRSEMDSSLETPYFLPCEKPGQDMAGAIASNEPRCFMERDGGDLTRTIMVPERSPGGRVYLACAEMSGREIKERLRKPLTRSIATSGVFLLLVLPLMLIFRRTDKERIEQFESLRELLHDKSLNRTSVIERKIKEFIDKH